LRGRIDRNIADNARRFERIKEAYAEFAAAMSHIGAEHLVLKGFAQWPDFVEHPRFRPQSDIDVYCPPESLRCAQDVLSGLGYEPGPAIHLQRADHLQPMIRRTQWKWRGNYYDPEIPSSFELHFCFWNERLTRLHPKGLDQFWRRRAVQCLDDLSFPALAAADNLGYLALNVLRDALRGPMTLHLLRELAAFLHAHAGDDPFWATWRNFHDDSLRRLEAVSFRFALHSFRCDLSDIAQAEIDRLPPLIHRWFERHAHSPFALSFNPNANKDALWLHIGLLESGGDRREVLLEGLFPTRIPPVDAPHIQNHQDGTSRTGGALRKRVRHASHLARRIVHHSSLVLPTIWRGVRWWWSAREPSRDFLTFLGALLLFNLGMYVFFFLYNLYLLDRGFKENFLGMITSAVTLGGVVGSLPSGIVVQRFGLRKALLLCLAFVSIASALRTTFVSPMFLLLFAFLSGVFSVIWAVALSPTIARLTSERNRTFGFSLVFFFGIAVGMLGGLIGGRLPGWLVQVSPSLTAVRSKEIALLLSCVTIALALLPVSCLRLDSNAVCEHKTYTWNPFLLRFLAAIAVWSVAVGSFSPFFTVYFSRYWHLPIAHIGTIDSVSHIPQLLAILAAPFLFRSFGLTNGIASAQIATAIALVCLASVSRTSSATAIYMSYVAFQWMSEPALYSLLMNRLPLGDRAGASALNFLVMNGSQAIAMLLVGAAFLRFGYPAVIMVTAAVSATAALLFWLLLGERRSEQFA
jgi:MFS family permease